MSPKPLAYDYQRQCWVQFAGPSLAPAAEGGPGEVWKVLRCGHVQEGAGCYACKHAGERITYPKGGPSHE